MYHLRFLPKHFNVLIPWEVRHSLFFRFVLKEKAFKFNEKVQFQETKAPLIRLGVHDVTT